MKAAVNRVYGSPDVIEVTEIAKPDPKGSEILIKVHASSVNRTDCGFLRAKPFVTRFFSGLLHPRNVVLGCEFAGEVVEVGEKVTNFKIGDRVFGFDDVRWGGHAQFKTIHESKSIVTIPKNSTYEQAATSSEGAHYALNYIQVLQKLDAKRVLVHGGTGAIGSTAIQLLKHAGIYVVATAPTKQQKLIKKLGADKVVDWQRQDFTKYPETFDAVFDAVGKSTFAACQPLLRAGGVYIATELGPHAQNPLLALLSPILKLLGAKRVLFPLPKNNKQLLQFIADRLADESLVPVIDKTYPLQQIADAYRYVETGEKIGNVGISISHKQ